MFSKKKLKALLNDQKVQKLLKRTFNKSLKIRFLSKSRYFLNIFLLIIVLRQTFYPLGGLGKSSFSWND
jgi:hypothetical protein